MWNSESFGRKNGDVMTQVFVFDSPVDDGPNRPFPDEIALDPWVLYHGTSGQFEAQIESQGLRCSDPAFTKAELEAVDAIFEALQWNGRTGASRAVLKPFSLGHDFGESSSKPTYFAECAYRAMTFATRDFAGGEAARALRHSFDELWEFINDDGIREPHLLRIRGEAEQRQHFGNCLPGPANPNLSSIKLTLESLTPVRQHARHYWENHPHGVVYAVRFRPSDLEAMKYHSSMGVKCFADILPERLIGKTRIPIDYANPPWLSVDWLELPPFGGIIPALREE